MSNLEKLNFHKYPQDDDYSSDEWQIDNYDSEQPDYSDEYEEHVKYEKSFSTKKDRRIKTIDTKPDLEKNVVDCEFVYDLKPDIDHVKIELVDRRFKMTKSATKSQN